MTSEKELAERLSDLYMLNVDADEPDRTEIPSNTCDTKEPKHDSSSVSSGTTEKIDKSGVHLVSKSKAEQLMELLDKREALQAELKLKKEELLTSDCNVLPPHKDIISSQDTGMEHAPVNIQKLNSEQILRNIQRVEEQKQLEVDSDDEVCDEGKKENVPMVMLSCLTKVRETQSVLPSAVESTTRTSRPVDSSQSSEAKSQKNIFTLLWQILHEWKTTATTDYLTSGNIRSEISNFEEKKYEALERTIDDRQIDEDFGETREDVLEVRFIDDIYYENETEIDTDSKYTEPNGNLFCHRSLCSMNTSTQLYPTHFLNLSRYRCRCRAV